MLQLSFTELLAIIGAAQSLYICVAVMLRPRAATKRFLVVLFFGCLFVGFAALALSRSFESFPFFPFLAEALWITLPFLCVFLLRDLMGTPVTRSKIFLICAPVVTFMIGWGIGSFENNCDFTQLCKPEARLDALSIAAAIFGAAALLSLWFKRHLIVQTYSADILGQARYWLALSIILIVAILLLVFLFDAANVITRSDSELLRVILGLSLVYLSMTSLFRLYDTPVLTTSRKTPDEPTALTAFEIENAQKIENLLSLDKVYQEPSYSRKMLARELDLPESAVSRIVNVYFQKSVPQLLNELRVKDACHLLADTNEPITVIAEAAGFSSIASFNRVFKEVTGKNPSEFRNSKSLYKPE